MQGAVSDCDAALVLDRRNVGALCTRGEAKLMLGNYGVSHVSFLLCVEKQKAPSICILPRTLIASLGA